MEDSTINPFARSEKLARPLTKKVGNPTVPVEGAGSKKGNDTVEGNSSGDHKGETP